MSQRDPLVALLHMRDHAQKIVELTTSRTRQDLDTDFLLAQTITRLLEILGEAARRVDVNVKQNNPNIPWKRIIALRNVLIHEYDEIDHDILWEIISLDLPPLLVSLNAIIK